MPNNACPLPSPVDWTDTAHALRTGTLSPWSLWEVPDASGGKPQAWSVLLSAMSRPADDTPWDVIRPVLEAWQAKGAPIDKGLGDDGRHVLDVVVDPAKVRGWIALGGNPLGWSDDRDPSWWGAMFRGETAVLDVLREHPAWPTIVRMRRTHEQRNDVMTAWANDRQLNRERNTLDDRHTPGSVRTTSFAWLWEHVPADGIRRPQAPKKRGQVEPLGWVHAFMDKSASAWSAGRTAAEREQHLTLWRQLIHTHMGPDDAPWLTGQVHGWKQARERSKAQWVKLQAEADVAVLHHAMAALEGLELRRSLREVEAVAPVPGRERPRL